MNANEADDLISEHGTAEIARRLGGGPDPHPRTLEIGTLEAIAEDEDLKAARWAESLERCADGSDAHELAVEGKAISQMRAKACRAGAEALRKAPD